MLFVMLGGLLWWLDKARKLYDMIKTITYLSRSERGAPPINEVRASRQVSATKRMTDYRPDQPAQADPMDDRSVPEGW